MSFLQDLAQRSRPAAVAELEEVRQFAREQFQQDDLQAWDIAYYSEKLRQDKYSISQEELKPYFPEPRVVSGLSAELVLLVDRGELDAALVSEPPAKLDPDLVWTALYGEPLVVIAPENADGASDTALLAAHPFIWFSRKTWAGQQIERRLLDRGIAVRAAMEVDSLEAIEALGDLPNDPGFRFFDESQIVAANAEYALGRYGDVADRLAPSSPRRTTASLNPQPPCCLNRCTAASGLIRWCGARTGSATDSVWRPLASAAPCSQRSAPSRAGMISGPPIGPARRSTPAPINRCKRLRCCASHAARSGAVTPIKRPCCAGDSLRRTPIDTGPMR
jgi:hypothetical protein